MFYRICWKLQKIYLHIRVTNISLINTLKKEKKYVKRRKKTPFTWSETNQN